MWKGLIVVTTLAACVEGDGAIELIDANPNSATYEQVVSVDDFSGLVSLWYFGHAT